MTAPASVLAAVDALIEREGGYVNHPADRGGPTHYGITLARARAEGYTGALRDLPRELAVEIYLRRYYLGPGLDHLAGISQRILEELLDTGVNMGPAVAIMWLQRWLNAFNREARDYPDIFVDGRCGPITVGALAAFLARRGAEGERVLLAALNCNQGHRYLEIAESRPSQEAFLYGWLRARVYLST